MEDDIEAGDLDLSLKGTKRIFHEHTDRVQRDALMRVMLEEEKRIGRIARAAKVMASHAGRETVMEKDVRKVYQFIDDFDDL